MRMMARFRDGGLELNEKKTQIVYCQDDERRGNYPNRKFDFLGYTFQGRESRDRFGRYKVNFAPAVSDEAAKQIRQTMRQWRLHLHSDKTLEELARFVNPMVRGWINYYGKFHMTRLRFTFNCLNHRLARWAIRKHKRFERYHRGRAIHWLGRIAKHNPNLFAHWHWVSFRPAVGQ